MKTTEQLQELLSVAERATTQQPWTLYNDGSICADVNGGRHSIAKVTFPKFADSMADGRHIAKFDPTTCAELVRRLMSAEAEVTRLRRGEFTPQEFQDLCHNKSVQDGFEAFADGCETYQEKLFGRCRTKGQAT